MTVSLPQVPRVFSGPNAITGTMIFPDIGLKGQFYVYVSYTFFAGSHTTGLVDIPRIYLSIDNLYKSEWQYAIRIAGN